MLDEKDKHEAAWKLTYNSEWHSFELDGYELQSGESIEVSVFGCWIPGQLALDAAGWYLFTLDQVSIRLQSGLPARLGESSGGSLPPLVHASAMHPPHILIVDDDPALLQALHQTVSLRLPLAQVDTSDSAHRALELIRAHDYDTIVSDIKMPGMDGLELLMKVHELRPETLTLLITGHGDHALAIRALRSGAYDYILKPIDRDYFVAALDHAIQTRQLRRQVVEQQLALELHSKSLEQLVQLRTHELDEANATKDQIIRVVSQELNMPLAHLKEMIQLLSQKLEGEDVAAIVTQGLADIEDSIRRTEVLVQELLTPHVSRQRRSSSIGNAATWLHCVSPLSRSIRHELVLLLLVKVLPRPWKRRWMWIGSDNWSSIYSPRHVSTERQACPSRSRSDKQAIKRSS